MHVAKTRRVYKGKTYVTHLLRRYIRKGETVTHETLGNLTHLPDNVIDIINAPCMARFVPDVKLKDHSHAPAWPC